MNTKKPHILKVRIDDEMKSYLDILDARYEIHVANFVRAAILEKMKRDIKALRVERVTKLKGKGVPKWVNG